MQIQLKQAEIVTALKQYIAQQGINLTGKTVDISFTAGRGTAGLSADIVIEDQIALPALDGDVVEPARPVLAVVPTPAAAPVAETPVTPEDETVAPQTAEASDKPVKSLFA